MTQAQMEKIHSICSTVVRNALKLMWIFPIKENRISFISHSGNQYSCNPKYVSIYLEKHYPGKFDRVFELREPEKWEGTGERFDKLLSLRNIYDICTSKVILSNCGFPTYLPKRKCQYVIHSWHGGGAYKTNKNGGYLETGSMSKSREKMDLYKSICTDLVLSSSELFTKLAIPELVPQYQGEFMNCGMPRNDIVIQGNHESIRKIVCDRLGIDPQKKIVLYAPTYRGLFDTVNVQASATFKVDMDMQPVLDAINDKYGCDSILLVRAHYAMTMDSYEGAKDIINVTDYPDTQELLCVTDILISDYSSIIWDFSLTKRPCFLYVPDMDYYLNEDRGTYTPIETWPGVLCKTNEELQDSIRNFDEQAYVKKIEKYHEDMGSYETGSACEQVCKRIAEVCGVE